MEIQESEQEKNRLSHFIQPSDLIQSELSYIPLLGAGPFLLQVQIQFDHDLTIFFTSESTNTTTL